MAFGDVVAKNACEVTRKRRTAGNDVRNMLVPNDS